MTAFAVPGDTEGRLTGAAVKQVTEMIKATAPKLTPESMLVVGPGRPDDPTTTGMTSEALAALPVGCEYRSTDGASVGAWVWRKRPTGWVVTDGDTGWVFIPFESDAGGQVSLRRTNNSIWWRFWGLGSAGSRVCKIPAWATPEGGPWMRFGAPLYRNGAQSGHIYFAGEYGLDRAWPNYLWLTPEADSDSSSVGHIEYSVDHAWPTTLRA